MAMIPVREGTANLAIGEQPPWLVFGVLGDPFHGKRADLGLQDRSSARRERARRLDDRHLFPGRDQRFERPRTLVKRENHARRGGDPRFLDEMVHRDADLSSVFGSLLRRSSRSDRRPHLFWLRTAVMSNQRRTHCLAGFKPGRLPSEAVPAEDHNISASP